MSAKVGSLNVDLTLETARFQKGLKSAQTNLSGFEKGMAKVGTAIAGAFAVDAIGNAVGQLRTMTREAVNTVGGLGEQAKQLGVNTEALQAYRYAASQTGVETGEMDQALAQLTRRLGDASLAGKGPVVEALQKLGITLDEIKGKAAGDVIPLIADGIRGLSTDAERAAVTVDLFGKAGQKLLPLLSEGAEGINKMVDAAREMGLVLTEEEIANADKYGDAMAALDLKVQAQLAAKLSKNAEALYRFEVALADGKIALIDSLGAFQQWTAKVQDGSWADRATAVMQTFNVLWLGVPQKVLVATERVVNAVKNMVAQIRTAVVGQLNAVWDGAIAKVDAVRQAFFNLWDKVTRRSYVPDMVDDIASQMARLDTVMVDKAKSTTEKTAREFEALRDRLKSLTDRLFPEAAALNTFKAEQADIQAGVDKKIISPQMADAMRAAQMQPAIDELREGLRDLFGMAWSGFEQMGEGVADVADKVADGLAPALESLKPKMTAFGEAAGEAFGQLGYQLKGVLLGAQSLGDALRNLVATLASKAFDMLWSALGTSLKIPGFASGTNFAPGGLALVGERGPELVNLPRGTRVHTTQESSMMMGGDTHISISLSGTNFRDPREAAGQIARRVRQEVNGPLRRVA